MKPEAVKTAAEEQQTEETPATVTMTQEELETVKKHIDELQKKLAAKLKSVLSIGVKVQLKAPNSIERSQGKSVRVIDNRNLK